TSASTAGEPRPIPFVEPAPERLAVREPAPPPAVAVAEPAARVLEPEPFPEPARAPIGDVEYRPAPRR
ncbi:MAG: 2-oxoglutarate dehydrogenase, E2 component, dihydrolipoamide succinyltransferase, partial [Candidatus Dormibacteraceae bacterium]